MSSVNILILSLSIVYSLSELNEGRQASMLRHVDYVGAPSSKLHLLEWVPPHRTAFRTEVSRSYNGQDAAICFKARKIGRSGYDSVEICAQVAEFILNERINTVQ